MRRLAVIALLAAGACREEATVLELGGEALDACALAVIDASDGLDVEVIEQSRWPAGACYEVTLVNAGDRRLEWALLLAITGALADAWNTSPTAVDGGIVEARGIDSSNNRSLEPGAAATIGFCLAC